MNTKLPCVGPTYRWEDNIMMDFRNTVFEGDSIELP
jgi:hypothetical protein